MSSKQCRCGGTRQIGPLDFEETFKFIGTVKFTGVEVDKCNSCTLFRIKNTDKYDDTIKIATQELLAKQPIALKDFINETEAALRLGIEKQALNTNKIKYSTIYWTRKYRLKLYSLRSINKFLETGDGRFPLVEEPESVQTTLAINTAGRSIEGFALVPDEITEEIYEN